MRNLCWIVAVALTLCFSETSHGEEGNLEQQVNPSQTFNFTSDSVQYTSVKHGKTDIFFTCYDLDKQQYYDKTKVWIDYYASSPETFITCNPNNNEMHYICVSDDKDSHTVKVGMKSGCSDPNS